MATLRIELPPNTGVARNIGFRATGLVVNNFTGYWLYVDKAYSYIPPNWVGIVLPLIHSTDYLNIVVQSPYDSTQNPVVQGQFVQITAFDGPVAASAGTNYSVQEEPQYNFEELTFPLNIPLNYSIFGQVGYNLYIPYLHIYRFSNAAVGGAGVSTLEFTNLVFPDLTILDALATTEHRTDILFDNAVGPIRNIAPSTLVTFNCNGAAPGVSGRFGFRIVYYYLPL